MPSPPRKNPVDALALDTSICIQHKLFSGIKNLFLLQLVIAIKCNYAQYVSCMKGSRAAFRPLKVKNICHSVLLWEIPHFFNNAFPIVDIFLCDLCCLLLKLTAIKILEAIINKKNRFYSTFHFQHVTLSAHWC